MSYTLVVLEGDTNSNKVLSVNALLGKPIPVKTIKTEDLKKKDLANRNPAGKIPFLQTQSGLIFETNTILRLLASRQHSLQGSSALQGGQVNQWLDFTSIQIGIPSSELFGQISGRKTLNVSRYEYAKKELYASIKIADIHLRTRTFLVGNSVTIADISLAVQLVQLFKLILDPKARQGLPHITRWYRYISSLPPLVEVTGSVVFCEEEHKVDFQSSQRSHIKIQIPAKTEESKGDTKEGSPAKSPSRPRPKKQQQQDGQLVAVTKGPFDHLVQTPFDLDLFKKKFFSSEDKAEAMKDFWKLLDYHGWSLWKVQYDKYEGQGLELPKTINLMKGMLRNMDQTFRKYAFASVGVYGKEGDLEIRSVWLWRGDQVPIFWQNHQSYDYHKFKRLSSNSEEDRKLVQTYWTQTKEGEIVEDLPVIASEYFK